MPRKSFGPAAHCGIDYALVAYQTLGPTLFRLTGPAKAIAYGFAAKILSRRRFFPRSD